MRLGKGGSPVAVYGQRASSALAHDVLVTQFLLWWFLRGFSIKRWETFNRADAEIFLPATDTRLAVEKDQGTERLPQLMNERLAGYRDFGGFVLFIAPNEKRIGQVSQAIQKNARWLGAQILFTTAELSKTPEQAIWQSAAGKRTCIL